MSLAQSGPVQATRDLSDAQLLEQFAARRDEAAFAALMCRHGGLVWHVCHTVLHQEQDAQGAFQASFLVLALTAASLRRDPGLANWLYGVAYRVAMNARRKATSTMTSSPFGMPHRENWKNFFPKRKLRLGTALRTNPSAEVRRRLADLLARNKGKVPLPNYFAASSPPSPRTHRQRRSPRRSRELAAGAPEARVTQEAKAAVDRLAKRATAKPLG